MSSRLVILLVSLLTVALAVALVRAQDEAAAPPADGDTAAHPTTVELNGRQWKVTGGAAPGYLPDRTCAACHRKEWEEFQGHGMARSFYRPDLDNLIEDLSAPPFLHEPSGLHYEMQARDGVLYQKRYRIDATGRRYAEREERVDWVIGSGNHSRGYMYQTENGELYQLPMVWYSQEKSWGMSPGFDHPGHDDFGRRINRECMFCHNALPDVPIGNDAQQQPPYFPEDMAEGIGCQRCHGPGARHVQLAAGFADLEAIRGSIVDPMSLEPGRRDDVCFQCHLQPDSRMPTVPRVAGRPDYSFRPGQRLADYIVHLDFADGRPTDEKFELNHHPYRLRQSRCYQESGDRMHCLTCHDAHRKIPAEERAAHYRAKCLSCHENVDACKMVSAARGGAADEQQAKLAMDNLDCTQCHMPERRTEDAPRVTMTDHRIVRGPAPESYLAPLDEPKFLEFTDARTYFPERNTEIERRLYPLLAMFLGGNPQALPGLHETLRSMQERPLRPWILVAVGLRQSGRPQEAFRLIGSLIEQHPEVSVLYAELGYVLLALEQLDQAHAALSKSLSLDDRDPEVHYTLGAVTAAQGNLPQAYVHYENALERRPHHAAANYIVGKLELQSRRVENARRAFLRAIASDSRHGDAYHQLGHLDGRKGDWSGCMITWQQGLEAAPGHAGMLEDLSLLRLTCSDAQLIDVDAGLARARELAQVAPDSGTAPLLEAMALMRRSASGDLSTALSALERAERLGGDRATRLYIEAVIRKSTARSQAEKDRSREIYDAAVEATSGSPDTNLRRYLKGRVARLFPSQG